MKNTERLLRKKHQTEVFAEAGLSVEGVLLSSFGLLLHLTKEQNRFKLHSFRSENGWNETLFCIDDTQKAFSQMKQALHSAKVMETAAKQSTSETGYPIGEECLSFGNPEMAEENQKKYSLIAEVSADEAGDWRVIYHYHPQFYSAGMADALHMHWETLLDQLSKDIKVNEIDLLTEKEAVLLNEVNQTDTPFSDVTVHGFIEARVEKYADLPALVTSEGIITYKEMNQKANQLARHLQSLGVRQGDFVPVAADRKAEIIFAILAIMKAGASYVPISHLYPAERLQFILDDASAKLVLSANKEIEEKISLPVLDLTDQSIYAGPSDDLGVFAVPKDTAGLIYTSGTTGRPKGVLIRHDTIVNYTEYNLREFEINSGDKIPQFAPFTFSTAIYEMMATFFSGAQLHIVSDEMIKDVRSFVGYIMHSGITITLLPPEYAKFMPPLPSVRILETGASECQVEISRKISSFTRHVNAYGLTEGSIVTVWQGGSLEDRRRIPIGKPVYNTKAYVLRGDKLCGMYMPGELCVTGMAVASGYLNLPELTAERFVPNPFGEGVMLKTGDIVQWNEHGEIEYLSRRDFQVQIRGMRVELGEVEFAIQQMPEITNVSVISLENSKGEAEIIAFVNSEEELDIPALKQKLETQLIDYMIPAHVHQIPGIPLTVNGKVDQKMLAGIHMKISAQMPQTAEEMSETQSKVSQLFQDILGIRKANLATNFLNEGGHSLKIVELLGEIEAVFGIQMKPQEIFENPTAAQLSRVIELSEEHLYQPMEKAEEEECYELTPAQKRIYFIQQLDPESTMYNLPLCLKITGDLDEARLYDSLDALIARHESLRTSFRDDGEETVQFIAPAVKLPRRKIKIRPEELEETMRAFIQPFDLGHPPLLHVLLAETEADTHYLLADFHHAIADGISLEQLAQDVTDIYDGKALAPLNYQYRDYSAWFSALDLAEEENYWLTRLAGAHEQLALPLDYRRPEKMSFKGDIIGTLSTAKLAKRLERLTQESGTTAFMVLLSALMILLQRYSGQDEIIVGSPVAGRSRKELKDIAGMFVNTLALKGSVAPDETFLEFLEQIKEVSMGAFQHQAYPFDTLVQKLGVPRTQNRNPLFDVMFSLQDFDHQILRFGASEQVIEEIPQQVSKFDMTWIISKKGAEFQLAVEYCTDIFREETVQRFMEQYLHLVDEIITYPTKQLKAYQIISQEELEKRGETQAVLPAPEEESPMIQLLEENAEQFADETILHYEDQTFTFGELNARANQIARYLRKKGVKPNDIVPIYLERSPEQIIAMLGVVKAGGAYVPLNDTVPLERIRFILEETKAKLMLAGGEADAFSDQLEVIAFSDAPWADESAENPAIVSQGQDDFYCLYTSGTTGKPKGVLVTHANFYALSQAERPVLADVERRSDGFGVTKHVSTANFTFDMFASETLLSLALKIPILLANTDQSYNQGAFNAWLKDYENYTIEMTPSRLRLFLENPAELDYLKETRAVILGGEKLDPALAEAVASLSDASLYNGYGPTEGTILVTMTENLIGKPFSGSIGLPNTGTAIYLLNHGALAGEGMIGEICIAGPQVSRGYLNQPALTQEAFLPNPYGEGLLYKTGDMGRWLSDGTLQYLRRNDDQVKIRGFRVELKEIEEVIRKEEAVTDTAVIFKGEGEDAEIIAYVTGTADLDLQKLRENLALALPYYMVPARIAEMAQLPLTASGKLDKHRLPKTDSSAEDRIAPPQSSLEQEIADIFCEVLKLDQVSRDDDFFLLGGHSLKMNQAANKIEKATGVRMPLQEMFAVSTPAGIAGWIEGKRKTSYQQIPKAAEKKRYPATSVQERLFVLSGGLEETTAYNMPIILKVTGTIDKPKLQIAFEKLVQRHEILRTRFVIEKEHVYQEIVPECHPVLEVFSPLNELDAKAWQKACIEGFIRPFDLSEASLIRLGLVQTEDSTLMLLDIHHVIADAVSVKEMLAELVDLYQGSRTSPLKHQFKDYSEWLRGIDFSKQEAYWLSTLEDALPVLELPLDYPRPARRSFKGKSILKHSSKETKAGLRALSKAEGSTEYMILLSAFMTLLGRYSQQEDMLVGTAVSGRTHPDAEKLLGMFVNTLALRGRPEKTKTFREFLAEVSKTSLQAFENQHYPLEALIEKSGCEKSPARNPLFDVMFVLQDVETPAFELKELTIEPLRQPSRTAKFDLTLSVTPLSERYEFELEFSADLFEEETIQRFIAHYEALLLSIAEAPDTALKDLNILTAEEKEQLITGFNQTQLSYDQNSTVLELFQKQVRENGSQLALVSGTDQMTYQELDEFSSQVAHGMLKQGLQKEDKVVLLMERGFEMMIAILGVLKAGGAYVPVDPKLPQERICFIAEDADYFTVLTNCGELDSEMISSQRLEAFASEEKTAPEVPVSPADLAYCIYTSGTTGRPKGVMVEHGGLMNLSAYLKEELDIRTEDQILQFANYTFDASVWEWVMALAHGAALHLISDEKTLDVPWLNRYIEENITVLTLPPQYASMLQLTKPRILITAGSEAKSGQFALRKRPELMINAYGPTEVTVCASMWRHKQGDDVPELIPIGTPIANCQVYILQENRLAGIDVPGELCVAGVNVARGYLNQPEQTARQFMDNPFGEGLIYRTGDLARWRSDGRLDYLGRNDQQVKIRGYRIELQEIELTLQALPNILDAAVVMRNDQEEPAIAAYLVSDKELDLRQIRRQLAVRLPDYMLPALMTQLSSLPLNTNGKLDTERLPVIAVTGDSVYRKPRNEKEQVLADVFSAVLGIEKAELDQNFFELGGDSIKAIRIVSKVRELGFEVAVKDIMNTETIEELAGVLEPASAALEIDQGEVAGIVEMTPIQQMFFDLELAEPHHMNQSVLLETKRADLGALEQALSAVTAHHDQLRAVFADGVQRLRKNEEGPHFELHVKESIPDHELADRIRTHSGTIQKSFDLRNGPLLKAGLYQGEAKDYLFLCIHHLAVDSVSWQIILEDLETAYTQALAVQPIVLPRKTTAYKDWAEHLKACRAFPEILAEADYWQSVGDYTVFEGESDETGSAGFASEELVFEEKLTEMLLHEAGQAYNTKVADLLLTALSRTVRKVWQMDQVTIRMESHGRYPLTDEVRIDRTAGWFTAVYPVTLKGLEDVEEGIIETKEMLRQIPNDGMGCGVISQEAYTAPSFLAFNYLGHIDNETRSNETFYPADLAPGLSIASENNLGNALSLDGRISGNCLRFDIRYDTAKLRKAEIEQFAEAYYNSLKEIVFHCVRGEQSIRTLSDFDLSDFDSEDLEALEEILED